MTNLKDELLKNLPPKPREVWFVPDREVRLHLDKRKIKYRRPVLIVASVDLIKPSASIINIIPLSKSNTPDKITFPIQRGYEETLNNFKPDPKSVAVIQFYQPIETKFFLQRCGRIDVTSYEAIQSILCHEVIGYFPEYDLSPE